MESPSEAVTSDSPSKETQTLKRIFSKSDYFLEELPIYVFWLNMLLCNLHRLNKLCHGPLVFTWPIHV